MQTKTVPDNARTGDEESGAPRPPDENLAALQARMKENQSQRTEVTGYINQLNIQLHRWQLRLEMLEARHKELSHELTDLRPRGDSHQA